jgi:hypothetical protein
MTRPGTPARGAAPSQRRAVLTRVARLGINAAAPVGVFVLLRPHVHHDLTALIVGAAIPTLYTVAVFLRQRRLHPVGVIAIGCFCIGLLVAILAGANELVFKLREDIWTGPLGLACPVSVAVRRPLLFTALQLVARRNTQVAERLRDPKARRISAVTTLVTGLILLVHALAMVVLALTTSTVTFLAVFRPIGWTMVGGGLAALVWWIGRQQRSRAHR